MMTNYGGLTHGYFAIDCSGSTAAFRGFSAGGIHGSVLAEHIADVAGLYSRNYPRGLDYSKAIDKATGPLG
jgi:hypothetical protein